jgi:hypothetical protein
MPKQRPRRTGSNVTVPALGLHDREFDCPPVVERAFCTLVGKHTVQRVRRRWCVGVKKVAANAYMKAPDWVEFVPVRARAASLGALAAVVAAAAAIVVVVAAGGGPAAAGAAAVGVTSPIGLLTPSSDIRLAVECEGDTTDRTMTDVAADVEEEAGLDAVDFCNPVVGGGITDLSGVAAGEEVESVIGERRAEKELEELASPATFGPELLSAASVVPSVAGGDDSVTKSKESFRRAD